MLQQLGDLTSKIVLVGGQALAFWANHYADRIRPTGPVNSKDIDFCGFTDAVEIAAERLGGTFQIPEPFSNTPNTGLVAFKDRRGQERRMDFLGDVYGLDSKEVIEWAIEVEVPVVGGDIAFKVMHPFHCLNPGSRTLGACPATRRPLRSIKLELRSYASANISATG